MFPLAARTAASNLGVKAKFAAELALLRDHPLAYGEAWYHEAAIAEAGQPRKS
jgi:hypothetical protein